MMKWTLCFVTVAAASMTAIAAPVTETDVQTAATRFVAADPVGSAIFSGRTVSAVRDTDGLWIVSLTPAGHVIFSGSDLVEPIVGFSQKDFSDPDTESPAFAILDGARKASLNAEASGTGTRNAKWTELLEQKTRARLRAGPVESPDVTIVPPFMQSLYNQTQPYNDYCPIYDSSTNTTLYRGRTPCGCTATAAAQVFRHFRWPARIDRNFQYDHPFTDTNGIETTFPIRFDGRAPIDWNALDDSYVYRLNNRYDLRDTVAESERHPIARLVLWADVMAQMDFDALGSGANYDTIASNVAEWYTKGTWVEMQQGVERIKSDIRAGIPCHVTLSRYANGQYAGGHAVIAHGWAEDGTTQYAYMNFGWGGNNDGYYNIADDFQEYQEKKVYVGHYPRAKPQIEPLPKVCGGNVTLNWHFPDIYTNCLSGFTVAVSKASTTPTTFLDDFSDSKGVSSSGDGIYITTDSDGYDGNLLFAKPTATGTYTHPNSYTLTSASVLTFKLYSFAALGAVYRIEGRFNGGEWTPLCTPALKTDWGSSGWSTERVYLGSHGGQTVQFRISNSHSGSYYPQDESRILIDDFQVTEILEEEAPTTCNVTAHERSLALTGLDAGASYSFTVKPSVSGALVDGENSDPVSIVVAGSHRTPVPGEQTYHMENLSFSASDTSGAWSYSYDSYGSVVDDSSVNGIFRCSIAANLPGAITAASTLSFQWSASNYQNAGENTWTAVFVDESGNETTIGGASSSGDVPLRSESLSLSSFTGLKGSVRISYTHSGSAWANSAGVLSSPTITNVQMPTVPAVAWDTVTMADLGTPAILSVSNVVGGVAVSPLREGLFRECKYGETTVFDVECSEHVDNLNAYSSHLALVGERQVTTQVIGPHTFRVSVNASNIGADRSRSRMILTLEAIDANGTRAYRDLSLRFSAEGEPQPVEPLEIMTSVLPPATSGVPYSVAMEASGGNGDYFWIASDAFGCDSQTQSDGSFSGTVGAAQGWKNDDGCWELALPFDFPFYGSTYRTVYVSSNGTLTFDNGNFTNWSPSDGTLSVTKMIAAMWSDLDTSSGDIYVASSSESVTVRWSGTYRGDSAAVSFSATLYPDGRVRLSYGSGNAYGGWIGVSSGNGVPFYTLADECSTESSPVPMGNANDIVFTPNAPMPDWLTLSVDDGILSGTPTAAGSATFRIYVMGHVGDAVKEIYKTLNLTIISPTPTVTPGMDTSATYDSVTVAAAVADINANKTVYIVAPPSLDNAPTAKAEYQNMFQAMPEYDSTAGAYKIVTRLTANAATALTADATAKAEKVAGSLGEIAADAAGEQTAVSVTGAKPGFYYSISYGTSAGAINTEGIRVRAGATGAITLQTPPKAANTTTGFYKVNVNVTDK